MEFHGTAVSYSELRIVAPRPMAGIRSVRPPGKFHDGMYTPRNARAMQEFSGKLRWLAAGQPPGVRASRNARRLSPYNCGKCVHRTTRFQTVRGTRGSGVPCFHKLAWTLRLRPTHPQTRPSTAQQVPRYSKILCCDSFPSPCPELDFRQSHPVQNHGHVCQLWSSPHSLAR